jgi:hypothetical protein
MVASSSGSAALQVIVNASLASALLAVGDVNWSVGAAAARSEVVQVDSFPCEGFAAHVPAGAASAAARD